MTTRQYIGAIWRVAKLAFSISPGAVFMQIFGAALGALLPIATTYFAALTTTELVATFTNKPGAKEATLIYVLITAGLGLIMIVWSSIEQFTQQVVRYRIEAQVSDMMYEHFAMLDFWRYDDKQTADLYDRANKFSSFFAWIFERLATILQALISALSAIIALVYISPFIAMLIVVAILPGLFIQFKISRSNIRHWTDSIDHRRKRGYIEWNILQPKQIAELRIYGMVGHLMGVRRDLRDKDQKARLDFERGYIGWRILGDVIEALAEVASLIWIVLLIAARSQPVGQFLFVQQMVSRALSSTKQLITQIGTIDEDLSTLKDYDEFMRLPRAHLGDQKLDTVDEISFEHVSF
ncbi:MAG TPA: ABC transporter transmembrane domain-containing protein, partial [Candidatus Saccharimonadales bacterium]|nr:ABC transporter transmembrane domain-containing protein [Candidatus Saccharimonadales bacterium]